MDAKAIAQAQVLDEAARALKQSSRLTREALQRVRQIQAELNGIPVEIINPKAQGAQDDSTHEIEARAA